MAQDYKIPLNADAELTQCLLDLSQSMQALDTSFSGTVEPIAPTNGRHFLNTDAKTLLVRIDDAFRAIPSCWKFTITHANLTNGSNGGNQQIVLLALPARVRVLGATIKHSIQFAGGGISTLDCKVGWISDDDAAIASYNLLAAVADTTYGDGSGYLGKTFAAENMIATFTPDAGHNLNALTAGVVDIWVTFLQLP